MKRKKLYYTPGLISIIALPVLLFFWGPGDLKEFYALKLKLPSSQKDTAGVAKFTVDGIYHVIKNKRKLVTVSLKGYVWDQNSFSFKNNVDSAIAEIGRLQCDRDTTVGLEIQLSNQNTYSDFLCLLNEAVIYDYKRYALIDNTFYLFPDRPPLDPTDAEIESLSIQMPGNSEWKEPTKWEVFKLDLKRRWWYCQDQFEYLFYRQNQNKLLAAGFLLLIAIPSIVKIRKYSRNRKSKYLSPEFSS